MLKVLSHTDKAIVHEVVMKLVEATYEEAFPQMHLRLNSFNTWYF